MRLLEVRDLHTSFFTDAGEVKAVNGISFNLDRGKVLGIVGESRSWQEPVRSYPDRSSSTDRSLSVPARKS